MAVGTSKSTQLHTVLVDESRGLVGVRRALQRAQNYLLRIQNKDGHWCAELEGDTILESEYILTMHFLGRLEEDRVQKAAEYIRQKQLPEGGWANHPGGKADVSQSAKAYFVLKLVGDNIDAPHLAKARQVICELGGLDACNTFTRIYLAIFGQYPWEKCPAVPPELILLPHWFPVNIYEMSSWSRGIVVPLAVIWAKKPYCPVPEYANISELWLHRPTKCSLQHGFWANFFRRVDSILRFAERHNMMSLWRPVALRACERWMIEHFQDSDGIGAIFPPIINSILALRCLGYDNEHPLTRSQIVELENLEIEEGETLRVAPCFSPVWDTALSLSALLESDMRCDHPRLLKSADWLLKKEVRVPGDWKFNNPEGEPGGWYFEYANPLYPDVDDTFQIISGLSRVRFPDKERHRKMRAAVGRALRWTTSMQNKDGGWGSFDKGCTLKLLVQIPFADHNAMIDPSTSDITGRALEAYSRMGFSQDAPVVKKAVAFLKKEQEADGSWFGRWGCNYIYGTFLALRGLQFSGEDVNQDYIQKGASWLRSVQNEDGGWGESLESYDDPSKKGQGISTPSQTAWALMGLMAAGDYESEAVKRGVEYLQSAQDMEGCWQDNAWTGTGFPRVFYLCYHLYATYFPLMALGIYEQHFD